MLREKVKALLDDYYGDGRGDVHKEEIVDFVRNYSFDLLQILKEDNFDED